MKDTISGILVNNRFIRIYNLEDCLADINKQEIEYEKDYSTTNFSDMISDFLSSDINIKIGNIELHFYSDYKIIQKITIYCEVTDEEIYIVMTNNKKQSSNDLVTNILNKNKQNIKDIHALNNMIESCAIDFNYNYFYNAELYDIEGRYLVSVLFDLLRYMVNNYTKKIDYLVIDNKQIGIDTLSDLEKLKQALSGLEYTLKSNLFDKVEYDLIDDESEQDSDKNEVQTLSISNITFNYIRNRLFNFIIYNYKAETYKIFIVDTEKNKQNIIDIVNVTNIIYGKEATPIIEITADNIVKDTKNQCMIDDSYRGFLTTLYQIEAGSYLEFKDMRVAS